MINDSTGLSKLVDDIRAKVFDLRERLSARDDDIRTVLEDSCASLGPPLQGIVDGTRAGLNRSVADAFRAHFIGSQFHAYITIECTSPRFSDEPTSNDGNGSNKKGDVRDPPADRKVI